MERIILEPEPKLLDIGAGAGDKNCKYLELEPENWAAAPQIWWMVNHTAGGNTVLERRLIAKDLIAFSPISSETTAF